MEELWSRSALELAALIEQGEVTSREVVQAHLARIDAVNTKVNAVVRRFDDEALAAADRADDARAKDESRGVLHGVPVTLKENLDLAGHPTTHGTVALEHAVATGDEPVVARLKAAGLIPLARTNLPDMAVRLHTDSSLHGATINPWDANRTPGGSSGGEAVALATGMSPLGIGGDMCGSLRWPAQCCGVSTLKPTLGSVPRPAMPNVAYAVELFAVLGPMARTVADLAATFSILAGDSPLDPWSVPTPHYDSVHPHVAPHRIAVSTDPGSSGTDPAVSAAIQRAAETLEGAGWLVEEAEPPRLAEAGRLWPEITFGTPVEEDAMGPLLGPNAQQALGVWAMTAGVMPDATILADALRRRTEIMRAWAEFFLGQGLWLTATGTDQPFEVGADLDTERVGQILHGHRVIMATNALGMPSAVTPVGTSNGLPQSVQLVGPRFAEMACLHAASMIEDAQPHAHPTDPK